MQNIGRNQPMQANGYPKQPNELLKTQDNLDLKEFWRTLVRRKRLVLTILAIILLLTVLFTLFSTPIYRATATLQIERDSTKVVDGGPDFSGSGDIRDTRDFYQTQFELLQSRSLMATVIQKLNLNESAVQVPLLTQIKSSLGLGTPESKQTALINNLLDNITVEPIRNSRIVAVNVDTPDAELSAKIANAIVDTFVTQGETNRLQRSQEMQQQLDTQIKEAKQKLEASEQALNEYARTEGILGIDNGDDQTTQQYMVTKLSEQIVQADNKYIALKTDPKATAEQVRSALEQANLLREELSNQQVKVINLQQKMVQYKTLQRETKINQESFQSLLQNAKNAGIAGNMKANNLTVVDHAEVPLNKYKPNWGTNLLFASLLGLLLGVASAFMKEFMYDGIKNVADLESVTGLPVLAAIPAAKNSINAHKIARLVVSDPKSSIAESFRALRTTLRFATKEKDNKSHIIYITSSCANEGKTTTASNLALAYANAGHSALLVDADLRNPSFEEALGVSAKIGLVDYLQGHIGMDSLVYPTSTANLHIITAGKPPQDPVELLSSKQMQSLLDSARESFDVVILDGPPVLGLADSLLLSSMADSTLLTINSKSTKISAIQNALKRLKQANSHIVGLVLNRVDTSGRLGYDYDYYYYKNDQVRNASGTST